MALIDLTDIGSVKGYLNLTDIGVSDALITSMITGASQYILDRTGFQVGANGTGPFAGVDSYIETQDGSGSPRLFLKNAPIQSVTSLQINGESVPASTGYTSYGYGIHSDLKSLFLRGGSNNYNFQTWSIGNCPIFYRGMQNVVVTYTAGYSTVPADLQDKVIQLIATNFKRRSWIDQKSQMLQQAGTISYRDWEVPPEVERVICMYRRQAVV